MVGLSAFVDHTWNEKFSSSLGYSMIDVDNTDGQAANSFSRGQYAIFNVMYYPATNAMAAIELQYGNRENYSDGFTSDIFKVQFSFKYNFSQSFYK